MKKIIINTDGASRGNPGKASIGVVFYNEKEQIIKEFGEYLGDSVTNNEAEYQAVIFALKKFKAVFGKEIAKTTELEIRADSELMVSQLNGKFKLVNENIQKFFIEIWNLKTEFISVKFKQIPREKNKDADRMANQALDSQPQTLI
jgi:ribonuclease HI